MLLEKASGLTPAEVKLRTRLGDKMGIAPLFSQSWQYTYDQEKEGILYAPFVLGLP